MLKIACLLLLFPVCAFVPGYLFTRKSRLPEELKLIQSISLSIMTIYLFAFLFYLLKFNWLPYGLLSALFLISAIAMRGEIFKLFSTPAVKNILVSYAIFTLWVLILLLCIRNYSGGDWWGDWQEHYERSLFFKDHSPLDVKFIGTWMLPARPPLYNVVVSFFLKLLGSEFYIYQATSVMLNSLVFFGACSALYVYAKRRQIKSANNLFIMTLLLCFNPSVVQNITFLWTRPLTTFFVIYSLALYVMAIMENNLCLRRLSYLNMGLATLTHYSAVPYLFGIVLMDLYFMVTRRVSLKESMANAGIFLMAFSTWIIFSLYHYGHKVTFGSNSTVSDSSVFGVKQTMLIICGNLVNTFIPHSLRSESLFKNYLYSPDTIISYMRDYFFLTYQTNFFFLFGSFGWLIVLCFLVKSTIAMTKEGGTENAGLLWGFLVFVVTLGIAVQARPAPFGVAHICLQPIAILGLAYVAVNYVHCHRYVRCLLWIFVAIDLTAGILLQIWMEHYVNEVSEAATEIGYKFMADTDYAAYFLALLVLCLLLLVTYVVKMMTNHKPTPDWR